MESLEEQGLKSVTKYAVVFYDVRLGGWTCELFDTKESADWCKGYGDFAGMSEVTCTVPIDAV